MLVGLLLAASSFSVVAHAVSLEPVTSIMHSGYPIAALEDMPTKLHIVALVDLHRWRHSYNMPCDVDAGSDVHL